MKIGRVGPVRASEEIDSKIPHPPLSKGVKGYFDRGRDDSVAPPSEPDVRISRIRLSSRWFTS